jgi:hypothetical protein
MKTFLAVASLFCIAVSMRALVQNPAEQKGDLYSACIAAIKAASPETEKPCAEYVAAAQSEDDQDRIRHVKTWLAKYSELRPTVQFLSSLAPDPKVAWLVYKPDIDIELPETFDTSGRFKIQVSRSFADPREEALLKQAEAVYPGPNNMIHGLLFSPPCEQELRGEKAPVWGGCGNDNIEMARVVTARAVRYYYDLTLLAQRNPDLPSGFRAEQTSMEYSARLQLLADYSHAQDVFHDVYVADLRLKWSFVCGGLCGVGFTRNKVVVLDRQGNVLALYLDAPVNSESWVS